MECCSREIGGHGGRGGYHCINTVETVYYTCMVWRGGGYYALWNILWVGQYLYLYCACDNDVNIIICNINSRGIQTCFLIDDHFQSQANITSVVLYKGQLGLLTTQNKYLCFIQYSRKIWQGIKFGGLVVYIMPKFPTRKYTYGDPVPNRQI